MSIEEGLAIVKIQLAEDPMQSAALLAARKAIMKNVLKVSNGLHYAHLAMLSMQLPTSAFQKT